MAIIRFRRGTKQEWIDSNKVLNDGELGYEKDTGRFKIGNGSAAWLTLNYFLPENLLTTLFATKTELTTGLAGKEPARASASQVQAETATSTTTLGWSPQRIAQLVASKLPSTALGQSLLTASSKAAARQLIGVVTTSPGSGDVQLVDKLSLDVSLYALELRIAALEDAPPPTPPSTGTNYDPVTHGDQISLLNTGPWALQKVAKGAESLTDLTPGSERMSTWSGNTPPSYVPNQPYVYNNDPANKGGIVPAGGMTIDGVPVPAGTWVVQFRNIKAPIVIEGDCSGTAQGGNGAGSFKGAFFRGCRSRYAVNAPGMFPKNGFSHGGIVVHSYGDYGGQGGAANQFCEIAVTNDRVLVGGVARDKCHIVRTYLSYCTTLAFLRGDGDTFLENYGRNVTDFGDSSKHLNGFGNSGGEKGTAWVRNNLVMAKDPTSVNNLTDIFQMAADFGTYPGTATNLMGSTGYLFDSNLIGGAGYSIYLGVDKANTQDDVKNLRVINNKFSQAIYSTGGSIGPVTGYPKWGVYNNAWSGNTWVGGASAGQTILPPGGVVEWPGANNTGHTITTALTTLSSSNDQVTVAGTVMENLRIPHYYRVKASNVTLRNCIFEGGLHIEDTRKNISIENCHVKASSSGYFALQQLTDTSVTALDSTFEGGLSCAISEAGTATFVGRRLDIFGAPDGVKFNGGTDIQDSWIHDQFSVDADPHYDALANDSMQSGWILKHNTIHNNHAQTSCAFLGEGRTTGTAVHGTFENNLLRGAGYSIYGGPGVSAQGGIKVINNVFDLDYKPTYGFVAVWDATSNTWSGNTMSNGAPVTPTTAVPA